MPQSNRTCTVEGCDHPSKARGYCGSHYQEWRRHGNISAARKRRYVGPDLRRVITERCTPSDNTGCWNWDASKNSEGYGTIWIDGHTRPAHRVAYEAFRGPVPDSLVLDHICHNKGCVNPDHLRAVTQQVNMRNRSSVNKNSRTGVLNVFWDSGRNAYGVQFYLGGGNVTSSATTPTSKKQGE